MESTTSDMPVVAGTTQNPIPAAKKYKGMRAYAVFAAAGCEFMGERLQQLDPDRFEFYSTTWGKFPDGTDNITLDGFNPVNQIARRHVIFLASFHNNDVTLSQFSVMIVLLQSFIKSLTILLPFYPVGTMERVDVEGRVATANTYATLLSCLPSCGKPSRLMIYDIHALQERFFFHGSIVPSLHTALPLLMDRLKSTDITAVVFPDDGAAKRFSGFFSSLGYEVIVCGKVRHGNQRTVRIQEGEPKDRHVLLVDDLIQTGGTLYEAANVVMSHGAASVYAYVTHGVFPNDSWQRFLYSGNSGIKKFWLTNSIPCNMTRLPKNDVFELLDLADLYIRDIYA